MSFIGVRSKSFFTSTSAFRLVLQQAEAFAVEMIKIELTDFLRNDLDVPRDTGFMAETAVIHLLQSGLTGELNLDIWFDTFYAKYVEDKVRFINKIKPKIYLIFENNLRSAFNDAGIDATVVING